MTPEGAREERVMEKQKGASLSTRPVSETADRPQPRPGKRGGSADHSGPDRQAKALVDPDCASLAKRMLPMPNPTQPSQAAREAAIPFAGGDYTKKGGYSDGYWIRRGNYDDHPLVQAFARFERDTEKRVRESLAGEASRLPYDETTVDAVQRLLERGRAIVDRDGFLVLAGEANVERVALDALCKAIDRAREMVTDEEEGLAAEIFAKCLNQAQMDARMVFHRAALATLERTTDAG